MSYALRADVLDCIGGDGPAGDHWLPGVVLANRPGARVFNEARSSHCGLVRLRLQEPEARPAGWLPMNEKHEDNLDRVWDIIEKVGVTMLTTQFSGGLRARPLEARPERDAGLIWFVTDVRSGKEHEIEAEHDVCLVFIDAGAKAYLSITARAEVRRDHAKAAEILEEQ